METLKPILLFLAICAVMISCEKDAVSNGDDSRIVFSKSIAGGCNNEVGNQLKSATGFNADTVKISIINPDTLNVFVGINYICCAPFVSETEVFNDTLVMTVSDTCAYPQQSCYCRCMCYYTWDFQFVDFEKKVYNYIVKLNDPREDDTIIFKEGLIDLTK